MAALSPEADLDALAKINEDIRERCISIVSRSDELIALRSEFIQVFGEVGRILKGAEGTSSALVERSAMLAFEQEEHKALKLRYRALHEENESNRNANSLLRGEIQRHAELVSGREARIQALETELTAEKDNCVLARNEAEQERYMANAASEKLQAALAEIGNNEALIAASRAEVAGLSDRCEAADFHVKALQASVAESQNETKALRDALAESQQSADDLGHALREAGVEIEGMRNRIVSLEDALSASRLEHETALIAWRGRAAVNADEIAALKTQVDAHRSHAEAGDKLLAEARAELQAKAADLRAKERQVELSGAKIVALDERVRDAAKEIADLSDKLASAEKSRAHLADRAQALVRAMSDQKAKLESAEQRAELLDERLAAESARFATDREELEQKVRDLTERFEKEKIARAVVSGALEAARSRANRPRGAESLLEILARADEADGEDHAAEVDAARLTQSEREPSAKPRLGPQEPISGARPSLPKARPLVAKREKQQGGRL